MPTHNAPSTHNSKPPKVARLGPARVEILHELVVRNVAEDRPLLAHGGPHDGRWIDARVAQQREEDVADFTNAVTKTITSGMRDILRRKKLPGNPYTLLRKP